MSTVVCYFLCFEGAGCVKAIAAYMTVKHSVFRNITAESTATDACIGMFYDERASPEQYGYHDLPRDAQIGEYFQPSIYVDNVTFQYSLLFFSELQSLSS